MKVLILGGTGLISTAITRQLLERGDDVTLYNRGRTEVRVPSGATTLHGDRKEYAAFEAQMADAGPFDAVIDMIGFVPEDAESLIRAFRGRVNQVIFCSTVDVYTKPAARYPYTEAAERKPQSDYGRNKVLCEDALMEADARGDFHVTIIRPASTYGEGGTLVHTFGWRTETFDRLRQGLPVVVHGDGTALWVVCHVDDEAVAFVNALGAEVAFGKAYHATGEEWLTWNRYHELICESMGWPAPTLVHIPSDLLNRIATERFGVIESNFQYNNIYDNRAACEDLGFRYTIPFIEGARRTLNWMEENSRIAPASADPFHDCLLAEWERLSAGASEAVRSG